MQRIVLLIGLVFLTIGITAQPPQLIPYQAIARDNAGNPVLNQNIGLRFSIHDQTISGTVVWQESQTVVSNNIGIIVTALGGTTQLTSVNWGSGAKFLQVEMDITGGANYLDMGTQQMMSVPYALYAETSGSVINNGGGGNGSFTHWIGELYGGGIIGNLWKDTQGMEHGMILSLNDTLLNWGLADAGGFGFGVNSPLWNSMSFNNGWDNFNSQLQVNYSSGSALDFVNNLNDFGFSDWYIPSVNEFSILFQNMDLLNSNLTETGSDVIFSNVDYLTSTVVYSNNMVYTSKFGYNNTNQSFTNISQVGGGGLFHIRAVRKF